MRCLPFMPLGVEHATPRVGCALSQRVDPVVCLNDSMLQNMAHSTTDAHTNKTTCGTCKSAATLLGGGTHGKYAYRCNICSAQWMQLPPKRLVSGQDPQIQRCFRATSDEARRSGGYRCKRCGQHKKGHRCTARPVVAASIVCKPKLTPVKLAKSVAVAIKVASDAKEAADRLCRTAQSANAVSLLVGAAEAVDRLDATVTAEDATTSTDIGPHWVSRTIELLRNDKVSPVMVKAQAERVARAYGEVIDASGLSFLLQDTIHGVSIERVLAFQDAIGL